MSATLEVGTVSIAAKAIVTAIGVAIATVVLTGLTGFLLDREVVPRLGLRPGAGFAMVTFTRWAIVIIGAALTLAALGIDMAKVTLLASAVGVGIGFGLQNVVNNFVSGLILIVERPVGVGDVIEIGHVVGHRQAHRHSLLHRAHGAGGRGHRSQWRSGVEGSGELDALRPSAPLRHRCRRRPGFRSGTGDAPAGRGGEATCRRS